MSTKVYLTSFLLVSASLAILPELTSAVYINEDSRIDVTVHSSESCMSQLERALVAQFADALPIGTSVCHKLIPQFSLKSREPCCRDLD